MRKDIVYAAVLAMSGTVLIAHPEICGCQKCRAWQKARLCYTQWQNSSSLFAWFYYRKLGSAIVKLIEVIDIEE